MNMNDVFSNELVFESIFPYCRRKAVVLPLRGVSLRHPKVYLAEWELGHVALADYL